MLFPGCWLEWVIGTVSLHLHGLTMGFWAQFQEFVLTFKSLYNLGPTYQRHAYSLESTQPLWSSLEAMLRQLATQEKAFVTVLPKFLNSLPT